MLGTNLTTGGAQQVLLNLAGWLHARGIPVRAVFMYDRDGLADAWQARYPFPIVCLDAWKKDGTVAQRLIKFIPGWLQLVQWMRREKFNAVLTFTHDANIIGLPAAWLAGIPRRFGSDHNRYPSLTKTRIRLHRWIINSPIAHGLVAVSKFTQAEAIEEGIHPQRIYVIHNGVLPVNPDGSRARALRQELLAGKEGFLVLSVGRLAPQKALHILIHAADLVLKVYPQALFCLAGEGPQRLALETLIREKELERSVQLLGNRGDVAELMAAADLFVLSSSSEGLPMALLEALACGMAVATTAIGGVADVIADGETGLLAPVDDPEALAGVICRALGDKQLRQRLGTAGKKLIEKNFSLDIMGEHYLQLLSHELKTRS
ncbi:MAG: glycosyltransferase [Anaerolineae bacterium]|nr:glycosyltransferase [Anaerolineae bacterium]